ncbi:ferrochelatase [Tessaracoccus sp. OH4464_COT-324]|uniref:ferrochelatase n=1 Tax=Tessaracoccus sp. OH4464_COT-324 TaxID=2491059 RepID=UPI000F62E26C|nr:ferrochelatase [Tessaracoccus sp. OH4464_COT-324]RRD46338.1 ferrochelatase [Tessaracoccus sp. OH4464_COT-324]
MKQGCLIVALGTPDAPTPERIREFLRSFLSDRWVVDFPRFLWKPILHGIVLRVRPKKVAPLYRHIWLEDGSPLEVYTRAQRDLLAAALPDIEVRHAMSYTSPSVAEAVAGWDVDHITVIPMYPHYAPSTTNTIIEQVDAAAENARWRHKLVRSWGTAEGFIGWYRSRLRDELTAEDVDRVVFSYHGVPQRKVHGPDEYRAQCLATTEAIMAGFDIPHEVSFQSKFGPGAWLSPATVDRMSQLPGEGVKRLLLLTPGFVADCIETLDELDLLNRDTFLAAGGESFRRLAPLNDHPEVGAVLAEVFRTA